ncbi:hypothetical protein PGB90_004030 [Kerria lacca]
MECSKKLSKIALVDFEKKLGAVMDLNRNFEYRHRIPKIDLLVLKEFYRILKKHFNYRMSFFHAAKKSDGMNDMFENSSDLHFENTKTNINSEDYYFYQMDKFKNYYEHLRNVILHFCFSLPNELNERTPTGNENLITYSKMFFKLPNQNNFNSHLLIGEKLGVLRYLNVSAYYLLKDAAVLEMAVVRFLSDTLQNKMKFLPFKSPDFCNSFVLQGAIVDNLNDESFLLDDDIYRLTGSASFSSFCAFRVNSSVNCKFLPERFFTCGRRYMPPLSLKENGLFTVCQRTNVHLSIAVSSFDEMMKEFDNILQWLKSLYEQLGLDFRICYVHASELKMSESCKVSVQLYSVEMKDFIEIGYLSVYNDFVSQRLRMMYHNRHSEFFFLYYLDGLVISVPILVACLLERSGNKMLIPECVSPYMYHYNLV